MQHTTDVPADVTVHELIGEFLAARAVRKPSVHTLQAYRRDLRAVLALYQHDDVTLSDLSPRLLRAAFARFAMDRSPASVARAWSSPAVGGAPSGVPSGCQ